MNKRTVGIIGGSGLYELDAVQDITWRTVTTPFGEPSDAYACGTLAGLDVVFLARHGRGHVHSPTQINYRANIVGFKMLGVTDLISVSAVGSLQEAYPPGHFVVVDQYIDLTKHRTSSFFETGCVGHVSLADPVCPRLSDLIYASCQTHQHPASPKGTYVCIEGPQFSTKAESNLYRSWGIDVIGMTNMPEAKLAREAGLAYVGLAMVTDFDCWHADHDAVTVETVIATLRRNIAAAKGVLSTTLETLAKTPFDGNNPVYQGAGSAMITDPTSQDPDSIKRLQSCGILNEL